MRAKVHGIAKPHCPFFPNLLNIFQWLKGDPIFQAKKNTAEWGRE